MDYIILKYIMDYSLKMYFRSKNMLWIIQFEMHSEL